MISIVPFKKMRHEMMAFASNLFILVVLCCLPGCAGLVSSSSVDREPALYMADLSPDHGLISRWAPLFRLQASDAPYNRIGTPIARLDENGSAEVLVDPARPAIYFQIQEFQTSKGSYTNLIYRVHFPETPLSLFPFYLTAGRNVGLLVVLTLNRQQEPVLITVVHTCGCYLAILPTSLLPPEAYPAGWEVAGQQLFGIGLPGRLDLPVVTSPSQEPWRLVVEVNHATHRVGGLRIVSPEELGVSGPRQVMVLHPMADLEKLVLSGGRTTSFFETEGRRKGYVKNSRKPWEMLFMSWWAMDLRIGEDKALGPATDTGTIFYTSIKFWDRKKSDMWPFADFLRYWGWNL